MILYAKEQEYGKDYTTRTSNMFLLRNDIHAMFDSQYFILAPKVAGFLYSSPSILID